MPHVAGALLGGELQLMAALAGLATALRHAPMAFTALQGLGVMYRLPLGWRMPGAGAISGIEQAVPMRWLEAVALQLLSPESWFMALATVSLLVPTGDRGAGFALEDLYEGGWSVEATPLDRYITSSIATRAARSAPTLATAASFGDTRRV